jgi:hypothetical protein
MIMAQDQAVTARNVSVPTELNPFLVQVVAVGVGEDLRRACDAAHASLRKRATQIRTGLGFPTIRGMYYALTNQAEQFSEPAVSPGVV